MTDDEALTLKPGDVVEDGYGEVRVVSRVEDTRPRPVRVYVQRPGVRPDGRRWNRVRRFARNLARVRRLEPFTANVYADWLDEQGEARAADLLRRAFPLDPGVTGGG